jgi:hypothetical protein
VSKWAATVGLKVFSLAESRGQVKLYTFLFSLCGKECLCPKVLLPLRL